MHLFVGLGNPGQTYARHRHNVGFLAVDAIAAAHGFPPFRARFQGQLSEGRLDRKGQGGERVALLKPQTYMNESGRSVGEAMRFFKLTPADVTVFHDELDLAPGRVRIKRGGGAAGHNGLRSIDSHVGAEYRRVRIGIGHPGHASRVTGYVLHDFSTEDAGWLGPLLDAMAASAPLLIAGEEANFLNKVATATQPPKPARGKADKIGPGPTTMPSDTALRGSRDV